MSELRAMVIVGVVIVAASMPVNYLLLKAEAGGEALTLSFLTVAVVNGVALALIAKHYTKLEERQLGEKRRGR